MEQAHGTQLVISAKRENIPLLLGILNANYVTQERRRQRDQIIVKRVPPASILIRIVFARLVLLENHRVRILPVVRSVAKGSTMVMRVGPAYYVQQARIIMAKEWDFVIFVLPASILPP